MRNAIANSPNMVMVVGVMASVVVVVVVMLEVVAKYAPDSESGL